MQSLQLMEWIIANCNETRTSEGRLKRLLRTVMCLAVKLSANWFAHVIFPQVKFLKHAKELLAPYGERLLGALAVSDLSSSSA